MFGPKLSVLSVIENHIKTLEFAYLQIYETIDFGLKQKIEIELGHAYHSKMNILKNSTYDNSYSKKNYPSKLNQEAIEGEDGTTDATGTQNMDLPELRGCNF